MLVRQLSKADTSKSFGMNPLVSSAMFLDERVLLNKAVLDVTALDAPQIIMANNSTERKERFNRASFSFALGYISPFIILPLSSRLAMRYATRLTKNFASDENKLIRLSYKYLNNADETKKGIALLGKELKADFSKVVERQNNNYGVIRQKLINAKNGILSFDLLFTSGSIGSIGFYNNWQTKKKTKQDGFSAEFNMADKNIVEKRAEKFKKTESLRKGIFVGLLALLALSPIVLKRGLKASSTSKFYQKISKIAEKFDYTDGIFMKRLPFFMTAIGLYSGLTLASRNKTELKDNVIRNSVSTAAFFGGDILIGSLLAKLSDRFLKTDIINKDAPKNILTRLIPPIRPLKDLSGKSRKIGAHLFWVNLAMLAVVMGYGTPHLINKMIRRDVKKDAEKNSPAVVGEVVKIQNPDKKVFEGFIK